MKSPDQAAFKIILVIAVLIAIAVLPLAARADGHRQGPPTFEDFDADGDGFVSQQEFDQFRAERGSFDGEGQVLESRIVEEAFDGIFGEQCLQLGRWGDAQAFLKHSRTQRKWLLDAGRGVLAAVMASLGAALFAWSFPDGYQAASFD